MQKTPQIKAKIINVQLHRQKHKKTCCIVIFKPNYSRKGRKAMKEYNISNIKTAAEEARAKFAKLYNEINLLDSAAKNEVGAFDFSNLESETMETTGAVLAKVENTISFMQIHLVTLEKIYRAMLTAIQPEDGSTSHGTTQPDDGTTSQDPTEPGQTEPQEEP